MQLEASHQTIRDQPAEQVADGRRDGADAGQDRHVPVLDSRQLEEQCHVAHDTPRDGAEDALHDHDAEGRYPEELQRTLHLGDLGLATSLLALGGLHCSLVPGRLHHEERHQPRHDHGDHTHQHEGHAPTLEAQDTLRRHRHDRHGRHEHAQQQRRLHHAEDLAAVLPCRHIRDDAIGDGPQRREQHAVQCPHQDHRDQVRHEGQEDGHQTLAHGAHQQDRAPLQEATVRQDAPKGSGQVRGHRLRNGHVADVRDLDADVVLQRPHARPEQHCVCTLHRTDARQKPLHQVVGLPVILHGAGAL
mmetsp:Transcript_122851/g.392772  ORF Transcript_122851/g.392772 Transcript_122851/m.392772 type:complete len:303 (-) Transcript_122851:192-1100(-)